MNLKRAIIVLAVLGLAISLIAVLACHLGLVKPPWFWVWSAIAIACVGLLVWALLRGDKTPDHLALLGLDYFEREGFCFALVPARENQQTVLNVFYQNRYENCCTAEIVLRPETERAAPGLEQLRLQISCAGSGSGKESVLWKVPPEAAGRRVPFVIGADVTYPQDRGLLVRSREGIAVGSIQTALAPALFHVLVSPARLELAIPAGVGNASVPPTGGAKVVTPPAASSPGGAAASQEQSVTSPGLKTSIKSEIKVAGTRQMRVVCEKCGHVYEYTLKREAQGTCESADHDLARNHAEGEARTRLNALLRDGCDVVPCPNCGTITARMRKEKSDQRGAGVAAVFIGCVVAVVGGGICWGVYLVGNSTGHYFFVVGIFGLLVAGLGILFTGMGIFQMITGREIEVPDTK